MTFIRLCLLLLVALLVGCDQASLVEKFASAESKETAQKYIGLLRNGQLDQIEDDFDPSLKTPDAHSAILQMARMVPAGQPISMKLVGAAVSHNNNKSGVYTDTNISYEYEYADRWLVVSVATRAKDGRTVLIGMHVQPLPDSLEKIHRFSLKNKSAFHYAIFVAAILVAIFVFGTLILCIRTKIAKRKWLWIVFILLGFCRLSLNWTTGQWEVDPLHILLFGSGFESFPYGPLELFVSIPLGAIVFLIRRKTLAAEAAQQPEPDTDKFNQT